MYIMYIYIFTHTHIYILCMCVCISMTHHTNFCVNILIKVYTPKWPVEEKHVIQQWVWGTLFGLFLQPN